MFVIVSYDIPQDKRRTKVMKLLKNYGRHVQYSVFECELTSAQLDSLRKQLLKLLHLPTDNVRLYYLLEEEVRRIEALAGNGVARDPILYMC